MSKSVISIALGSIASKAIGLVREVLFAAWFGAGDTAAAFRIAQTGFLLPTHALVGDSLGAGLLPLYREMQHDGNGAQILVAVASLYGVVFSAISAGALYVFALDVAAFIAPGAPEQVVTLAAMLLKVLALAMPFYVLGYLLSYVEAGLGRFGAIAWRPMIFNIGSIAGAALAVATQKEHWLATGLVVGHLLFFLWAALQLRQLGLMFPNARPTLASVATISGRFFRNMAPLLALPLLAQGNGLVERIVSSWLGTAVIPSVDYARFISETAIQLVAFPLGVLTMSTYGGARSVEAYKHVRAVVAGILLLSIPVAVFISQNAVAVVTLLFARGRFDEHAIIVTSDILRWLGGGLGAAVAAYYLIKALNAQLRNKEALLITLAAVTANVFVNVALWRWLGSQTLGIGAAAYAVVLLILCMSRLRLWRDLRPLMTWLGAGCAAQLILSWIVSTQMPYPFDLLGSAMVAAAVWMSLILRVQVLRLAAAPVLSRVPLLHRYLG